MYEILISLIFAVEIQQLFPHYMYFIEHKPMLIVKARYMLKCCTAKLMSKVFIISTQDDNLLKNYQYSLVWQLY